eukprot:CAMPEP_0185021480 /NCGR_PEP_ID=MMETSP1103-20130426/4166_1 /TAXON_ID=36769 /ORGANISM="Paraphysomonas bandaiensis, Strain Caron Lab Isolate" /LENGTH=197 /DNA_ID=CAMNT_0027553025 /DNA_START=34 /DNA_END=625 /DNA_ORIENTATION=-
MPRDYKDDSMEREDRDRGDRGDRDRRPRGNSSGETSASSLLVRNISYNVSSSEIRRMFEKYGDVRDVYIPLDHYTQRPRGFAFVEFHDGRDARDALENLDGRQLDGRDIKIVFAKENRKTPEEMRRHAPPPRRGDSRDRRGRDRYDDRDAAVAAAVTVEAAGIDLGHALVTMTDADIKKLKYMIQVSRCDDGAICIW